MQYTKPVKFTATARYGGSKALDALDELPELPEPNVGTGPAKAAHLLGLLD